MVAYRLIRANEPVCKCVGGWLPVILISSGCCDSIPPMAKVKRSENLVALRCTVCKRRNYYVHKNKKQVERKIEFKKFCNWCRKQTPHKEMKITGK